MKVGVETNDGIAYVGEKVRIHLEHGASHVTHEGEFVEISSKMYLFKKCNNAYVYGNTEQISKVESLVPMKDRLKRISDSLRLAADRIDEELKNAEGLIDTVELAKDTGIDVSEEQKEWYDFWL